MNHEGLGDPPTDPPLDALLARYLEAPGRALSDGNEPTATEADDPEALREFLDNVAWMRRLVGPIPDQAADPEATSSLDGIGVPAWPAEQETDAHGVAADAGILGTFGDFELLAEIARGGMGIVYKARQTSLNRIVAVKMILSGQFASEEDVRRFHAEARAAAHLHHPGIVPVYEVGERAGRHYYSMAFIDGVGLNRLIRDDYVPAPREAAELLRRIADAIHYAHKRGVIHRDLKPANILLERSDRDDAMALSIGGQVHRVEPRITDFGLAKRIDADAEITGTGQILGTPTYMAPEQAAGKADDIGIASDIYALGALLYCLLTGHPPFRSATPADTLQQVIHKDPIPPRQVNPAIPRDLETICLECLHKAPARRYRNARALAEDLRRFLEHEPIAARPVTKTERTVKWLRRNPALAGLIAASLLAVMTTVGLAAAIPLYLKAVAAGQDAENQKENAEKNANRAERAEYLFRIALSERLWRDGDDVSAAQALELLRQARNSSHRDWEWNYLLRQLFPLPENTDRQESRTLGRHRGPVLGIAVSSPGGGLVSAGADGTVQSWVAGGGSQPGDFVVGRQPPECLAFSGDGRYVAAGFAGPLGRPNDGGEIVVWSTATGHIVFQRAIPAAVASLAMSATGDRVAAGLVDDSRRTGAVKVWDVATRTEQFSTPQRVLRVALSGDGALLAGILADAPDGPRIKIWDAASDAEMHELEPEGEPGVLAFSPDGKQLLVGEGPEVSAWDVEQGMWLLKLSGHSTKVRAMAFNPDLTRLVTGSDNGTIKVWNWELLRKTTPVFQNPFTPAVLYRKSWSGPYVQPLLTLHGSSQTGTTPVTSLAFSRDGHWIVSGSDDGGVRLFDGTPDPRFPFR